MRIDTLRVQNFRGFAEREFAFHSRFNVLIGDNGTGKTAVMEALKVAVASWLLGVPGGPFRHGKDIQNDDIRQVGYMNASTGRPNFEEANGPTVVEADGEVAPFPTEDPTSLVWSQKRKGREGGTSKTGASKLKAIAERAVRHARENAPVVLPLVAYYGTDRLHAPDPDREAAAAASRLDGYNKCVNGRINTGHFRAWMKEQAFDSFHAGEETEAYRLVRESLTSFLPEADDVNWAPGPSDDDPGDVYVRFNEGRVGAADDRSGRVVTMSSLSDGYQSALAIAGDLAVRMIRLNSMYLGESTIKKTPGVVLIDELDQHLHPKWQRRVVQDLKRTFPSIQFVTTTHSPFIIQALDEGELVALDNRFTDASMKNHGIETIAEEIMGVEHPEQSPEYREKRDAARNYLELVMEAKKAPGERLAEYEKRLASELEPFDDDPAFQAYLEMKKEGLLST